MSNLKVESFYKLISSFSKSKNLKKNIFILEIGCGNGNLTNYFYKKGNNCLGIDVEFKYGPFVESLFSKGLIKLIYQEGNNRKDIHKKNLNYFWPCRNNSIDLAFSSSVIEHILNLEEFISENSRVLKKGGYCIHYFPSRSSLLEAHIGIPFGGIFINKLYYRFMSSLGLCKKNYSNFIDAYSYMKKSTNYVSKTVLINLFDKYDLKFVNESNDLIIRYMGPKYTKFLSNSKIICWLFGILRSRILIFKKK